MQQDTVLNHGAVEYNSYTWLVFSSREIIFSTNMVLYNSTTESFIAGFMPVLFIYASKQYIYNTIKRISNTILIYIYEFLRS